MNAFICLFLIAICQVYGIQALASSRNNALKPKCISTFTSKGRNGNTACFSGHAQIVTNQFDLRGGAQINKPLKATNNKQASFQFNENQRAVFASISRTLRFLGRCNFVFGFLRLLLAIGTIVDRKASFRVKDLASIIPNAVEMYIALLMLKSAKALHQIVVNNSKDDISALMVGMTLFDHVLKKKRPPTIMAGLATISALLALFKAM